MNIVFITLSRITDINTPGIYTDLLRQFMANGHEVYIVRPVERRFHQHTNLVNNGQLHILSVKTLNIQKTNVIEKGIGTILLEYQFLKAVRHYFGKIHFDLILYSTPPITVVKVVDGLRRRNNAITYLMLKDIFPQNAVDMQMFSIHSLPYRWFRRKEKRLYAISDYIGCMSPANIDFLKRNNPSIDTSHIELCPNAIDVVEQSETDKTAIRKLYGLPPDKRIFVYGGNLGKPQGIDFLTAVLAANQTTENVLFLIVGSGTESHKIEKYIAEHHPSNAKYLSALPREDYDRLVRVCDVGLIFLDRRFTIPNYPSRLLAYLNNKMPILIASDTNTDVGRIAKANGYGDWCESGDLESFNAMLDSYARMTDEQLHRMGEKGYDFMQANYDVKIAYKTITEHIS